MVSDERPGTQNDPYWYDFLTKGDATERRLRRIFRHIPYGPRCKLCAAPFNGPRLTTRARSGLPDALRPARTPAASNPDAAVTLTAPLPL